MKKGIVIMLLFSMISTMFLPSCSNTEGPGVVTTTVNTGSNITTPDDTTTGTKPPDVDPAEKTAAEVIAEIDALTDKRILEIKSTKDELQIKGTKYYVSEDGDDLNDGKSPEKAWKTMVNLNKLTFASGDAILFKRGDTFRGHIQAQTGVTYAAYGEGEKPLLIANEITEVGEQYWSLLEGTDNIWVYYKDVAEQGNIIFNDGEMCGFKVMPSYKDGKPYVQWSKNQTEFDVKKELDKNLEFVCLADSILAGGAPNVENLNCVGKLYLRCDEGNPGKVYSSIEFAPRVFTINAYADYVTVDNLCFKYTGAHAIGGGMCSNLKVTNCEFGWIGGSIQFYQTDNNETLLGNPVRYGNAVQAIGDIRTYEVANNYIYHVYDAGITHQVGEGGGVMVMQNIKYTDNVILYCTYSIEYFLGAKTDSGSTRYMQNVIIENNISRYVGFGFGNQRGDVTNAAHIKGWDHANYLKDGADFIIRNNIFDRSRYMMIHCGAEDAKFLPTFEDNLWVQFKTNRCSLGRYGANPTSQRPFTERNFKSLGVENDPEMYVPEKDWLWELPF